jgi:hypothetical protein
VKPNDAVGVAILALAPFWIGFWVWLLAIRPRRRQAKRTLRLSESMGMPVLEPDRVGGRWEGLGVEVRFRARGWPWRGRSATVCQVWIEPRFPVAFAVSTPLPGAGCTKKWAERVYVGGPTPEAVAFAERFAPLVQANVRSSIEGLWRLELDRASVQLTLFGEVFDVARLRHALKVVIDVARHADRLR